ncbi:hypothetical protein Tco_0033604 [Tanacetum coccineum]
MLRTFKINSELALKLVVIRCLLLIIEENFAKKNGSRLCNIGTGTSKRTGCWDGDVVLTTTIRSYNVKKGTKDVEKRYAKSLLQAVEKRFRGNAATKKTKRNLLKQYINGVVNTAHGATTTSTQSTAVNLTTIDNLSDAVICAFFASQPNSPQLDNERTWWSVTTATKGDTLQGSAGIQGTKKTGIGRTREGIRVIKQKKVQLTLHSWLTLLQVLTLRWAKRSMKPTIKVSTHCQIVDKCKTSLVYNAIPPPYTRNFMPPKPDLSFSGLEEFVNEPIVSEPTVKKPIVETSEAKASKANPKAVRKNNSAPLIEDWVSDSEEDDVPQTKIEKKTVKPSFAKIEFVKSKEQVKSPRKTTVKQDNQNKMNIHSARGNQRN